MPTTLPAELRAALLKITSSDLRAFFADDPRAEHIRISALDSVVSVPERDCDIWQELYTRYFPKSNKKADESEELTFFRLLKNKYYGESWHSKPITQLLDVLRDGSLQEISNFFLQGLGAEFKNWEDLFLDATYFSKSHKIWRLILGRDDAQQILDKLFEIVSRMRVIRGLGEVDEDEHRFTLYDWRICFKQPFKILEAQQERITRFGTPLTTAAIFCNEAVLDDLLARGVEINRHRTNQEEDDYYRNNFTPLIAVAQYGNISQLQKILNAHPDVNLHIYSKNALLAAMYNRHCDIESVRLLLDAGINIEFSERWSWDGSALSEAINRRDVACVGLLIDRGASINSRKFNDEHASSALKTAAGVCDTKEGEKCYELVLLALLKEQNLPEPVMNVFVGFLNGQIQPADFTCLNEFLDNTLATHSKFRLPEKLVKEVQKATFPHATFATTKGSFIAKMVLELNRYIERFQDKRNYQNYFFPPNFAFPGAQSRFQTLQEIRDVFLSNFNNDGIQPRQVNAVNV